MATPSYPSMKPLPKVSRVTLKKIVPRGQVRQADYEREQFQKAFSKAKP